jgi:RimJ/RimL family protein N-acetyltransferase
MQFPKSYKCLTKNVFRKDGFKIIPIRFQDRMDVMKWRNEQIHHLRQDKPISVAVQNSYFENVVAKLFDEDKPSQILFSFLENDICIGYGGLVHINWSDKNAEISFVMNTNLENEFFKLYWVQYLGLIEQLAFKELCFHKIFTFAFDVRPILYHALESVGFVKEAVLEEHCFFDGKYRDVIIHSKKNKDRLELCLATIDDAQLLFDWANDKIVRFNSLVTGTILWEDHLKWFNNKLHSQSKIYLLFRDNIPVGQIRFDFINEFWIIDYSIDEKHRGKGFGKKILELAIRKFNVGDILKAIVKNENVSSLKIFQKLGFERSKEPDYRTISFTKKIN